MTSSNRESNPRTVGAMKSEVHPPKGKASPAPVDARLDDAVRKGWITPAVSPGSKPPRGGPPVATLAELLQELEGDRADR